MNRRRLRAEANELYNKGRELRQAHQEKIAHDTQDAMEEYQMVNLKPGDKENAMSVKPDPGFPDTRDPNRIQLITVSFSPIDPPGKPTPRGAWGQRTKDTFDLAALARLLE